MSMRFNWNLALSVPDGISSVAGGPIWAPRTASIVKIKEANAGANVLGGLGLERAFLCFAANTLNSPRQLIGARALAFDLFSQIALNLLLLESGLLSFP